MTKGTKPTASKRTKRSLRKKNRPDFPPSFIYRPKYTSANKQKKIINPSGARPILDPANLAQESPEQRHKRIIEEANRVIRASKIEYKEKWITPSPEVKREVFKPIQQDNYIFASWNIKQISKSGWSRNLKNGLSTNGVSTRNHYIVSTIEAMECDIINIIEPRPDDAEIIKNNAVTELNKLKCFLGTPWVGIAAREDNLSMFYTECFSVPSGMYDSHILLYKTPLSPLGHAPISQDLDGIFRPVFDIESAKLRYLPNEPNQVKMPDEPQEQQGEAWQKYQQQLEKCRIAKRKYDETQKRRKYTITTLNEDEFVNRVPFYIKLEMNGISVNFISYHAPSPDTLNTLRRKKPGKNNNVTRFKRNTQFKIINKELKKMDAPFIFSGDFNTKGKYLAELSTFFDIDDCKNDFFNTREYRIPPATTLKAIPTKKSKEYKKFQASENKSKKMTTRPDSKGSYEEFLEYNFFSRPIALSAPSARRKFIGNNAYITPGSYYDHIFAKGLEINNASTYDFVESFGLNNNYATFNIARAISDHFPVYATLKFSDGSTSTTTSDSSDNQHTTKPVEPPMKKKRTTRGNLQKT